MRLLSLVVLALLVSSVSAQSFGMVATEQTTYPDELASSTEDNKVIIITPEPEPILEKPSLVRFLPDVRVYNPEVPVEDVKASFDVESIFPELLDKTDSCSEGCRLEYTFTNTLADVVPVSSIYLKQYDLEGVAMANNLRNYKARFLDADGNTVSAVKPGETITVSIEADKVKNIDMDVVPSLILTKSVSPDLKASRVDLDRNDWAIWAKGPAVNISGMKVLYSLDESSGALTDSASGFNLAVVGSPTYSQVAPFNKGILFPGSIGGTNFFNGTRGQVPITSTNQNFTIVAWVKPRVNDATRARFIYTQGNVTGTCAGGGGVAFGLYNSKTYFCTNNAGTGCMAIDACMNQGTIPNDVWTMVSWRFNGTHHMMNLNGTQVQATTAATTFQVNIKTGTGMGTVLGASHDVYGTSSQNFNGTIDSLYVMVPSAGFSGVLTDAQLNDEFNRVLTEANFTNPLNNSVLNMTGGASVYYPNITAVVGFGDQTVANITYTIPTWATFVLKNSTGEYNQSGITLTRLNSTHYQVFDGNYYAANTWVGHSLTACGGNAIVSCTTQSLTFTINPVPFISALYPPNNSLVGEPIQFSCNVTNFAGCLESQVYVYNDSGSNIWFGRDGSPGNGQKDYSGPLGGLPPVFGIGNYSYECFAFNVSTPTGSDYNVSSGRIFFNSSTNIPESVDSFGECITDRGKYLSYSATSETVVRFNLTGISSYLFNSSAPNLWIEGPPSYSCGPYCVQADTSSIKLLTVWLGGFTTNYPRASSASAPSVTVNLTNSSLTSNYNEYWLELRNESAGNLIDPSKYTSLVLDVYCLDYAPDHLDLKSLNRSSVLLYTKERPLFNSIKDGTFYRKYRSLFSSETIKLFFISNSTPFYTEDFALEDYVGHWDDSYLQVYLKVNRTLERVAQDQWYRLSVTGISLANLSYVQYVLIDNSNGTNIIAWDLITGSRTNAGSNPIYITIKDPDVGDAKNYSNGVTAGFASSYNASTVQVSFTSTEYVTSEYFSVRKFNQSTRYYDYLYNVTVANPGTSGNIVYVVPEVNATYSVQASFTTALGTSPIADLLPIRQTSAVPPYYDSLGLPVSLFGVEKDTWYTLGSMVLVTASATMFDAINVGTGGIVFVLVIGLTWTFGWFRDMTSGVVVFLFIMAVIYELTKERRRDV